MCKISQDVHVVRGANQVKDKYIQLFSKNTKNLEQRRASWNLRLLEDLLEGFKTKIPACCIDAFVNLLTKHQLQHQFATDIGEHQHREPGERPDDGSVAAPTVALASDQ